MESVSQNITFRDQYNLHESRLYQTAKNYLEVAGKSFTLTVVKARDFLLTTCPDGIKSIASTVLKIIKFAGAVLSLLVVLFLSPVFKRMFKASTLSLVLMSAIRNEQPIIVNLLLKISAYVNEKLNVKVLQCAISENNVEIVRLLLEAGADPNERYEKSDVSPLLSAISQDKPEIVRLLLEAGADPNERYEKSDVNALSIAISEDKPEIVRLLLNAGVNPNEKSKVSFLSIAISENKPEIVRLLLEAGADPNENSDEILLSIATSHNPEIVRLLLDSGATMKQKHTLSSICENKNCKKIVTELDEIAILRHKEWLRLQALGHSLKHLPKQTCIKPLNANDGNATFEDIGSGGVGHKYWASLMAKVSREFIERFSSVFPSEIYTSLIETLETIKLRDSQELFLKIQQGLPVFLSSGFKDHHIIAYILKDHFIICNSGGGSRKPVEVFKYNTNALTPSLLEEMLKMDGSKEEYSHFYFERLPELLNFQQNELEKAIENSYTLEKQIIGNCSWQSNEIAVWAFLALHYFESNFSSVDLKDIIEQVSSNFDSWLAFNQLYQLERYLGVRFLRNGNEDSAKIIKSYRVRRRFCLDEHFAITAYKWIKRKLNIHPAVQNDINSFNKFIPKRKFQKIRQFFDDLAFNFHSIF